MKRKIPVDISRKYKLPSTLTDFQLSMYIHLIEWKWGNITRIPGINGGREYDAILPTEAKDKLFPLYQPLVSEIAQNHDFKFHKHFGHMASSQAACINLFTPALLKPEVANTVFPKINPQFAKLAIDKLENGFQFEYWHESNPLNDHTKAAGTDSDVAIAYYDKEGNLSLWLIEHKLTEDEFTTCGGYRSKNNSAKAYCKDGALILKDHSKCYYQYQCNYRYWQLMDSCSIFDGRELAERQSCPFIGGENQLWRNQLMGHAIEEMEEYDNVHFSVVYHHGNPDLDSTINAYKKMLCKKEKFSSFTSKDMVEAARTVKDKEIQEWLKWYSGLYKI